MVQSSLSPRAASSQLFGARYLPPLPPLLQHNARRTTPIAYTPLSSSRLCMRSSSADGRLAISPKGVRRFVQIGMANEIVSDFKRKLPDMLTIARVIIIPFFMLSFILGMKSVGIFLYISACITDMLDGYLARLWNVTSEFGAFLDPVVDKLMVCTALVLLVCQIPVWWFACPVVAIILREISVSALREWMAERKQRDSVQVSSMGKVKTATQMVATALLLMSCPGSSDFDVAKSLGLATPQVFSLGLLLLYISTALTLASGFQYFATALKSFKGEGAIASKKFEG